MKLRIGDLITVKLDGKRQTGFVTALSGSWHVAKGMVEYRPRRGSLPPGLPCLVSIDEIIKVVPRCEVKSYWKYL